MSDKKNIDRLFQEKFKDFEVTPDSAVWEKIKAREKKKKRVIIIPFWYRVGGVAALIAVLITIGALSLDDKNATDNLVNTQNQTDSDNSTPTDKILTKDPQKEDAVVTSDHTNDPSGNSDKKDRKQNQIQIVRPSDLNKNQDPAIATMKNDLKVEVEKSNPIQDIQQNTAKRQNSIVETSEAIKNNKNPEALLNKQNASRDELTDKNEAIAENQTSNSQNNTNQNPVFNSDSNTNQKKQKDAIADNNPDQNAIEKNNNSEEVGNNIPDDRKKSIFDVINKKEEEESAIAENNTREKWNVTPNVAPVYYNSIGSGSSVKGEFSNNNKDGEFNLSYGIQVAYNVNPKLSIRSGIHKLDLSYNTEDVGFGIVSINRDPSSGIANANERNIVVSDFSAESAISDAADVPSSNIVKQNPGLLNHSLSYIEVPLEIKYDLIDKKFGVHLIGGVSTLFLNEDSLTILTNGFQSSNIQREEFNVNEVSFTGNVGLGLNYKLSKQFQVNLEPMFKYQVNGFKNSSEDFNPFFIGVYTGLSIKF